MLQGRTFDAIAEDDFARLGEVAQSSDLCGKTLLLTGATGFFGAWLLAYLGWLGTACGQVVRVFAVSRDPGTFLRRHPWAKQASWLHWIEGDIRTFEFPDARIDAVLHAATDTSATAGRAANEMLDGVILGTRRVLECAARANAGRVLLVSSGAVYGAQPMDVQLTTEDSRLAPSPLEPNNVYAEAKRVMELLGAIHARDHGAAVMVARCFAFVGAGLPLDGHFAIGNFIRDALEREVITVRGGGQAVRSYLYAADLAIWLLRILTQGKGGNAYNVGSDHAMTVANLAHEVARTLSPNKPVHIEGRDGASPVGNRYVPSIARCRSELGLDVWTPLPTAVVRTAQRRSTRGT